MIDKPCVEKKPNLKPTKKKQFLELPICENGLFYKGVFKFNSGDFPQFVKAIRKTFGMLKNYYKSPKLSKFDSFGDL